MTEQEYNATLMNVQRMRQESLMLRDEVVRLRQVVTELSKELEAAKVRLRTQDYEIDTTGVEIPAPTFGNPEQTVKGEPSIKGLDKEVGEAIAAATPSADDHRTEEQKAVSAAKSAKDMRNQMATVEGRPLEE